MGQFEHTVRIRGFRASWRPAHGTSRFIAAQLVVGWPRFGIWIDRRGITADIGASRYSWWQPRADLLHHARQLPAHWYGRASKRPNPNLSTAAMRSHLDDRSW